MIGRDVMTCIELIGRPGILREIGVKDANAERVLTEAQTVVQQAK